MFSIKKLRAIKNPKIIMIGNHAGIVQSVLDFDYLAGKDTHSVAAIVGVQQKTMRYFWGDREVLIPCYTSFKDVPSTVKKSVDLFAVAQSGRRVLEACKLAVHELENAVGGMIFAEGVPEQHAIILRKLAHKNDVFILGPASVGLTVAGLFKLGAIGGTTMAGIDAAGLTGEGSVAVISSSGGMVNELINMVAKCGGQISFAAAVGGERFPATTPLEIFTEAMSDKATKAVLYFGELGGQDEYDIAEYLHKNKPTKPVICYIAGAVAEYFDTPPQFGHAKAMAANKSETTSAKKAALTKVGVTVANNFIDFEEELSKVVKDAKRIKNNNARVAIEIGKRSPALFVNRVSSDKGDDVKILGESLIETVENNSFTSLALNMLMGTQAQSKELKTFFDYCMKLLIDHGPQVSGAVNTMITARAGKDLASSLATGILTVGPRFGGAINQAASNWLTAVDKGESAYDFVERFAKSGQYVPGIGHKKYRSDNPDPRVRTIIAKFDIGGQYLQFAKEVEQITLSKKSQLILNVDGAIAALALDILSEKEGLCNADIQQLISSEFFNAIFILSRAVGFTAHFMEQKRLDEGLFRLPDDFVLSA